ncbi:MAG: hypothetical protein LBN08_02065 [Lactobacillales bacterium]|jgi:hypothetical protein|nr:hypothetical protein [Lactobacillales bacterium]
MSRKMLWVIVVTLTVGILGGTWLMSAKGAEVVQSFQTSLQHSLAVNK